MVDQSITNVLFQHYLVSNIIFFYFKLKKIVMPQ